MVKLLCKLFNVGGGRTGYYCEVRQKLYELRSLGIELRNEHITVDDYFKWDQRFEHWHSQILDTAAILNPELRATLSLFTFPPEGNRRWAVNIDHNFAQHFIWEAQRTITKYLDQTRP